MSSLNILTILVFVGTCTTISANKVPQGFTALIPPSVGRDSYYFIVSDQKVDWYTARQVCESIGPYRFVSLESEEKSGELYLKLSAADVREAWTSGNDILRNEKYVWAALKNQPFGEFQDWRTGTPPNNPNCHCISVTALAGECGTQCIGQWGWDEEKCALRKRAVCEPVE